MEERVRPRIALRQRLFRRAVVFRVKDFGLFPEGQRCEESDDGNVAVGNDMWEFFHCERADRQVVMRHKFRMGS